MANSQTTPGNNTQNIAFENGPKRKQCKNACTNCQKACKKCDDVRPCPRCVKYGIADTCVDSIRKERRKGIKRGPYKKRQKQDDQSGQVKTEQSSGTSFAYANLNQYGEQFSTFYSSTQPPEDTQVKDQPITQQYVLPFYCPYSSEKKSLENNESISNQSSDSPVIKEEPAKSDTSQVCTPTKEE